MEEETNLIQRGGGRRNHHEKDEGFKGERDLDIL
jgi:hypothetical protein